ncbi:hypothetical protein H7Y29_00535 [Microbacteriaceae bacterium]|nr:hypothetical protein [Candidatus Saccharibacteria bacterium]
MNTSISAVRALTSVTFQQMLKPASWIAFVVFLLLHIIVLYVAFNVSAWWLLLLAVIIPVMLIVCGILAAFWYLARRLMPRPLLPSEAATVSTMVGKVFRLLEARSTPLPIIMFFIAKDVMRGKGSSYLETIITDGKGLKDDFASVKSIFEQKTLSS